MATLEEVTYDDYQFEMNLQSSSNNGSWIFSEKLNKLFVKHMQPLQLFPTYKKPSNDLELFFRAMIVPIAQEDSKVCFVTCPNHRSKCADNNPHILRCVHKTATYTGTEDGYYCKNRLQVALNLCEVAPNEPISLQFFCQNSCSGGMQRKQTAVIFTLEDRYRNILGKKFVNFKVCSAPKRDVIKEEQDKIELPKKRKSNFQAAGSSKKIPKIKQEPGTLSQSSSETQLEPLGLETVTLKLTVPKEEAPYVLQSAHYAIAGRIQKSIDPNEKEMLQKLQLKNAEQNGNF